MTTLRTAAQQALEALKIMQPEVQMGEGDAAITALRAALAEPVQDTAFDRWWDNALDGPTPMAPVSKETAQWIWNAALAEPALQTCNCRWDGEVQVQQCTLHEAHVDAIKEWAQRAKFAEKKLAALAEEALQRFTDVNQEIEAALGCDHCNSPLYAAVKCRVCGRVTSAEPVQEPVAWMYSDDHERMLKTETFCTVYSVKVGSPDKGVTDVPLYTSPQPQQTEPSQDTPMQHEYEVTANDDGTFSVGLPDGEELRIIPPQRKPPATIDEMFDRMDKAPKGVFFGVYGDVMTIWMEAWRAAEQHHGIKEGT